MKWISVKNDVPDYKYDDQEAFDILMHASNNRQYTGYAITEYGKTTFYQPNGRKVLNVTHWMPLPEPPKDE